MRPPLLFSLLFYVSVLTAMSQTPPSPLVIAHRGSSAQAPENTLPAFELAWQQEADGIEADFQLTKDGHIVCFHDKDTKRIAGEKLLVKDATLAALRELDAGTWKGEKYKGTRIPTIAEVLATIPPGKKIFIEIKCGPEIIDPLVRELASSGLSPNQVVVICFDSAVLKALNERDPQWRTGWLCSFAKKAKDTSRISPEKVMNTLGEIRASALLSGGGNVSEDLLGKLTAAGIQHYVWTINDPKLAASYRAQGTGAIITDVPLEMLNALSPQATTPQ
jgi:glycerophosphoryl diester phosphodiesterase